MQDIQISAEDLITLLRKQVEQLTWANTVQAAQIQKLLKEKEDDNGRDSEGN